ncbi:MAG: 16S rRNA (cytosine(967)-C(5))-methyltransferase RsmB [Rhodocyclaceae bacterium]|nr:16S rRNA (cytosine(967)-C(5))-methyltransferase RsmB [Rhodocyclaceae bacterium]
MLAGRPPETVLRRLPAPLRPAATDLAMHALRDYGRGEFFLQRLLVRPLTETTIQALLLVALARLERRPERAYTLVDQAVRAAPAPFKALVNAVLRNFSRARHALIAAADADEIAGHRHPRWWLEALARTYPEQWRAIVAADNGHPPQCLRINRRRITPRDYCARLEAAGLSVKRCEGEAIWLARPVPLMRLPGFAEGLVSVQDWGAQQAAHLLGAQAGERVLDACAAPGNKSAHLLELADIELTAIDLDRERIISLTDNLARLGLVAAQTLVADAMHPETWWDGRPYQRILLDAPCSASGVARRHPDVKWLRRESDVAAFAHRQLALLQALWPLLAPGGKMLYATCSLFSAENGCVIEAFLARQPSARRLPIGGGESLEWQLIPTADHDGFYYALLAKAS